MVDEQRDSNGLGSVADPQALLKGIFEHSPVSLQVYKADGHCLLVNRGFRTLFGSEPPAEYNVLHDEILEAQGFLDLVRRAFAGETVHVPPHWYDARELRQVGVPEGRRVGLEVTLFPLRGAGGTIEHIALCAKDVTAELDLRATTEALRQSEEQLRQAHKLEAVGRLAGGIAHDFNNLLSVILSYSDLLLEEAGPNAAMAPELREIRKAGQRAADLTRQMLAFSRQQMLNPKTLDLNEILSSLSKMLARVLGEDIELKTLLAPDLGKVKADPGQFEQVIMNLAVNARDAMPSGGKLTIETANIQFDESSARDHVGLTAGPHVMVTVSDTGIGMDGATQARIFEPFFTTKETGKGTGLGLSTVFGIVKQSGGNIWLHSEPRGGTTFKIYLPMTEGKTNWSPSQRPPAPEAGGTETILLVEDEAPVRAAASGILKRAGYHVLEAQSPQDALLISEQHPLTIHLLLTDVVMPKMDGRQLAERIGAMRPDIRTVFMSGYTDDVILRHGVLDAGVSFLQKPFDTASLGRQVRQVLDEEPKGRT